MSAKSEELARIRKLHDDAMRQAVESLKDAAAYAFRMNLGKDDVNGQCSWQTKAQEYEDLAIKAESTYHDSNFL